MSRHRNTDKKDRSEIPPATGTLKIDLKITLWRDQFRSQMEMKPRYFYIENARARATPD